MSREFGSDFGGFFHNKVAYAAEDADGGRLAITQAWAKVLHAIEPVAYAISSAEACDSGEDAPIRASLDGVRAVKQALAEVEAVISSHSQVAQDEVVETIIALLPEPVAVSPEKITIRVPNHVERSRSQPHFYARLTEAMLERVRRWAWAKGLPGYGWVTTGSSLRLGDDYSDHFFVPASEPWQQRRAVGAAIRRGDLAEALRICGDIEDTK